MAVKGKQVLKVQIAGGKYTVIQYASGATEAQRYGSDWRDISGDNLILALAQEVEMLREQVNRMKKRMPAAKIYTDAREQRHH